MPNPIQKEFRLEKSDRRYNVADDHPTLVTIRQTTPEENELREVFLSEISKQIKEYTTFIEEGYRNSLYKFDYEGLVEDEEYIDDIQNRFMWVKERIQSEIIYYEICLTLAACNIQQPWNRGPAFKFINGHLDGPLSGLSADIEEEIHEKVLAMNPSWRGELDRVLNPLMQLTQTKQKPGNFKDLALASVFSKSRTYLINLVEEINSDVFDNKGSIKINVSTEVLGGNKREFLWALKKVTPPLENIILYCSPILKRDKNSHIGVIEHGKFEIRVIARRDKFNYWDTNIERIVETLRDAIEWWKNKSTYSQYELDGIAEAAAYNDLLEEGKAFWSEMEDYGYDEDDF